MYVWLPEEDNEPGKCGKLVKAMYGTRDAAQNWEWEHVEFLKSSGFKQGSATPCAFALRERWANTGRTRGRRHNFWGRGGFRLVQGSN